MLVAASTHCFPNLSFQEAIAKLVDLEFTNVEITFASDGSSQLQLSDLLGDFETLVATCRNTHRLNVVGYDLRMEPDEPEYYEKFEAACRLAKATKVVQLTINSGELGTPFNEEVERLRKLVDLATRQGARVSIRTQIGRLSEDPDTVVVLCDNVEGLGLTFDPSHYLCGPHRKKNLDKLMKYTYHVLLRDSTEDELQVRVGQGVVEYGRLVAQLEKVKYNRALAVDVVPATDIDHMAELRKMRRLLESLL